MFKSKPKETPPPASKPADKKKDDYKHPFATKDDKIAAMVNDTAKAVTTDKKGKAEAAPAPVV